ncbi:hypothetical protein BC940DRAFT_296590 [Gongronella butleri]|nr:hypothetical protein BC940DRAFT_296590 [Gongronella butleri]
MPVPRHSNKTLYITHLSDEVTEKTLREIFSMIAAVKSVQMQEQQHTALMTFDERQGAEQALHTMDGRVIHGQKISIQWYTKQLLVVKPTCRMLVDGLHEDVTPAMLEDAFAAYHPKHVEMFMDTTTNLPLGHALLDFEDKADANEAMMAMDGKRLFDGSASSAIRCCWANNEHLYPSTTLATKTAPSTPTTPQATAIPIPGIPTTTTPASSQYSTPMASPKFLAMSALSMSASSSSSMTNLSSMTPSSSSGTTTPNTAAVALGLVTNNNKSYEEIFAQTPPYNTTVQVTNLSPNVPEQDLVSHFHQYGYVLQVEINHEEGRATLQLDTHGNAATAIFALQGFVMDDQAIELSWAPAAVSKDTMSASTARRRRASSILQQVLQPNLNNPTYYDMLTTRPPAPVVVGSPSSSSGRPGEAIHGWNQYYQSYYSAGHQNVR